MYDMYTGVSWGRKFGFFCDGLDISYFLLGKYEMLPAGECLSATS